MATDIQWTDDTWNPVTGCSKVSPGCAHCYAERVATRLWAKQYPQVAVGETLPDGGPSAWRDRQFTDVMTHDDRLTQPLRWKKPRKIFVNSMSDLFHEDVPDAFIDQVFAVMALASQHTFQILTKRADRMRDYIRFERGTRVDRWSRIHRAMNVVRGVDADRPIGFAGEIGWPIPNVWLGVSVENQHFADERIPLLLQTPAAVRFISAEPLLGTVDLDRLTCRECRRSFSNTPRPGRPQVCVFCDASDGDQPGALHQRWLHHVYADRLDWVIVGGESGGQARPFNVGWARSLVRQCTAAGVAVFVKQLGKNVLDRNDAGFDGCTPTSWPEEIEQRDAIEDNPHGYREEWQGADVRVRLRDSHGGDMAEWPADLQIRQFPEVRR